MYTGVSLAEQLEFDSWPEAQKQLARRVLLKSEVLYAVRDSLPPRETNRPPKDKRTE